MAEKIATYTAKELALRPSNAGYEAAQQAGRRLGPLAETAARAISTVADLNAKVVTELGAQQTAFLRFEGLEAKEDHGGGVKYGGGLKDMFQLGAGGNEPNYARLNRLSELQDGTLAIAGAARHIVNAQSPLTHGLRPQQAWDDPENYQVNTSKTGIQPNAEPSYKDFQQQLMSDQTDDWAYNSPGNDDQQANGGRGTATSSDLPAGFGSPSLVDKLATGGVAPPDSTAPNPTTEPNPYGQQPVPPPPDTSSQQWPTVSTAGSADVPTSPADNSQAPPMWGTLQDGM